MYKTLGDPTFDVFIRSECTLLISVAVLDNEKSKAEFIIRYESNAMFLK